MPPTFTRRTAMSVIAGAAAGSLVAGAQNTPAPESGKLTGKLQQAACRGCYSKMSLDELCEVAVNLGLKGIDLLGENEWATVKKHGLICTMANGPSGIVNGWNLPKDHDNLIKESERLLPLVAEAGLPNMILLSGNRRGMDDKEGLKNCAKGIKRIAPLAEKLNVTLCMELLNSKRDHKDYQCDHTPWGAALVDEVGSPRFKLLYDVYHMQIMEGDVIATITRYKDYIAHFHTGGVPGRHEIDETQELNYRRICEAIVANGFTGYLAHEFTPVNDPVTSLTKCAKLCDV
jgi:hydroxypyruvate isomerase